MNQFKNEIKSCVSTHDVKLVLKAVKRRREDLVKQKGAFLCMKVSITVAEEKIKEIDRRIAEVDGVIERYSAEVKHRRIERIKDKIFGFVVQFFVSLVVIVLYKIWVS